MFCWICCNFCRIFVLISFVVCLTTTLMTTMIIIWKFEFIETTNKLNSIDNEYMIFFAKIFFVFKLLTKSTNKTNVDFFEECEMSNTKIKNCWFRFSKTLWKRKFRETSNRRENSDDKTFDEKLLLLIELKCLNCKKLRKVSNTR